MRITVVVSHIIILFIDVLFFIYFLHPLISNFIITVTGIIIIIITITEAQIMVFTVVATSMTIIKTALVIEEV